MTPEAEWTRKTVTWWTRVLLACAAGLILGTVIRGCIEMPRQVVIRTIHK